MVKYPSRRKVLKTVGASAIGLTISSTPASACHVIPGDCSHGSDGDGQEAEEYTAVDSYTGPEMRGGGDFTITLASSVIEHKPIWVPSLGKWECDISVSGIADCRFEDDNSPAEEMWWHECRVTNQQFSADLYTREDTDWGGVKIGNGRSSDDYSEYPKIESAIGIGLSILNPAAGTGYAAGQLLNSMIEDFGQPQPPGRKWEVDSPLGGPTQHFTGYYHKYRAELESSGVTMHDLTDTAIAYPEYPVSNTFEIISGAPTTAPDDTSTQVSTATSSQTTFTRHTPHEIDSVARNDPHLADALRRHDSPLYVAHQWPSSVRVKPNYVPDEVRDEYDELNW